MCVKEFFIRRHFYEYQGHNFDTVVGELNIYGTLARSVLQVVHIKH